VRKLIAALVTAAALSGGIAVAAAPAASAPVAGVTWGVSPHAGPAGVTWG
jgi:hypothetical protein